MRSSWWPRWSFRSALKPLASGVTALGLTLGSIGLAQESPWREAPTGSSDPEPLPLNLPISPLAPRMGDPGEPAPIWHNKPNDAPLWLPGRVAPLTVPTAPLPSPNIARFSLVEVAPKPRLAPRQEVVPAYTTIRLPHVVVPVQNLKPVEVPRPPEIPPITDLPQPVEPPKSLPDTSLPSVEIRPIPPDKPKVIPPATDELIDPKPKPPVRLGPPREMEPKKLPPIENSTPRQVGPAPPGPTLSNSVWGGVPMTGATPLVQTAQAIHDAPPPATVPNKHGGFGSPNVTLSRDKLLLDAFRPAYFFDDGPGLIPSEAPAGYSSFVQSEFLLWWVNPLRIPVLAATGSGAQAFGYLGQPGTQVLLGPGEFGDALRTGFRTRAGTLWETPFGERGVDGGFFFLGKQSNTVQFDSKQFATISRPFFAPNFNSEFAQLVAFPGLSTGTLLIEQDSLLWGADANFRIAGCRTCNSHSEWFVGYRHLNLDESLGITEFILAGPNAPDPVGTSIVVTDAFETRNQFHGAQIGWAGGRQAGRWSWDARFGLAMGVTHQQVDIRGDQRVQRPGEAPVLFDTGGLLAAGPNIGRFTENRFSVVPEATFNVGYLLTPTVRTYVGYNFLYWSNVARPGDQIDRVVDLSFVPNGPNVPLVTRRPLPTFSTTNLFVQGIQFGLEARW